MSSEMIERVMAAMKEAGYVEGMTFEQEQRHIACAAIDAMRSLDEETINALASSYVLQAWPGTSLDKWPAGDADLMRSRLAKAVSDAFHAAPCSTPCRDGIDETSN